MPSNGRWDLIHRLKVYVVKRGQCINVGRKAAILKISSRDGRVPF